MLGYIRRLRRFSRQPGEGFGCGRTRSRRRGQPHRARAGTPLSPRRPPPSLARLARPLPSTAVGAPDLAAVAASAPGAHLPAPARGGGGRGRAQCVRSACAEAAEGTARDARAAWHHASAESTGQVLAFRQGGCLVRRRRDASSPTRWWERDRQCWQGRGAAPAGGARSQARVRR